MRIDHAGQRAAHRFRFGGVHAQSGAAGFGAEIEHVEASPGAGDNSGKPPGIGARKGARPRDGVTRGAIKKLQVPLDRVGRVLGFDRQRIGGVDEGQPAGGVARPYRRRQLLDQGAQRSDFGQQRFVAPGKIEKLALDAARILEPKHRTPGDGAALCFDRTAAKRGEGHRKRLAAVAQCLDRLFHCGCSRGIEPAAERQHAMRRRRADDGRIALDGRLIGRRRPVHHDLRLRQEQRVGAVEAGAQRRDLVV